MSMWQRIEQIIKALALVAIAGLIAGCASNRVISDGPHSNLMLKGYDPVAYFTDGKPIPGKVEIAAQHEGLDYRFVNEDHRKLFLADPEHYVPKYGGFCAQGAAYALMFGGERVRSSKQDNSSTAASMLAAGPLNEERYWS